MRKISLELICDHCGKNILNETTTNANRFMLGDCAEGYKCIIKYGGEISIEKDLCIDCAEKLKSFTYKDELTDEDRKG